MKATEQYFYVVLFIMLYKIVLVLKPVDKNEGYSEVRLFDAQIKVALKFESAVKILNYDPSNETIQAGNLGKLGEKRLNESHVTYFSYYLNLRKPKTIVQLCLELL